MITITNVISIPAIPIRRLAAALGMALLIAACNTKPPTPTASATPSPSLTLTATAPLTATASSTLPPGVTPTLTPTLPPSTTPAATLTPSPTFVAVTATVTPTASPFQVSAAGALAVTLPADSSYAITGIELAPDGGSGLVLLNDGRTPHVERLTWDSGGTHLTAISDQPFDLAQYSPDGSQIVFAQTQYGPNGHSTQQVTFAGLLLGDSSGANRKVIVQNGFNPAWSAQGTQTQIAFLRAVADESNSECATEATASPGNCFSVVVYNVARQAEHVILTKPFLASVPLWSPDGKAILIQQSGEVGSALDIVDLSVSPATIRQLLPNSHTPDVATAFNRPIWSQDGKTVIYAVPNGGLWAQPIDGGTPSQWDASGAFPYWPPGSHWLYYLKSAPQATPTSQDTTLEQVPAQQIWRLDPTAPDPSQTAVMVLATPLTCQDVSWSLKADRLACLYPVDNLPAVTLYAVPVQAS